MILKPYAFTRLLCAFSCAFSCAKRCAWSPTFLSLLLITGASTLTACSSNKVKPLQPRQELRLLWSTDLGGDINYPATLSVVKDQVATATSSGRVAVVNVKNGEIVWKLKIGGTINSGAGFDGTRVAVVTQEND